VALVGDFAMTMTMTMTMTRRATLAFCATLALTSTVARAQTITSDDRYVVFAEIGFARTVAPESLIGDGPSVSGGFGFKVTPGKTIQGIVNHVLYYRDVEWQVLDGRVTFVGAEIAFHSNRPRFRPFITVGPGVFAMDDIWIKKRFISPGRILIDPPIHRNHILMAMTASGGVDIGVAEDMSIRLGARVHAVLDRQVGPDDVLPFMIFRPNIGAVWRF
jgi:hypothetical protein